ncbi:MAG TPA: YetF domain-containing protein [Amnibacterium sp.]|jgi:uncharacterized membrane protein YcaP (DUF421 family)
MDRLLGISEPEAAAVVIAAAVVYAVAVAVLRLIGARAAARLRTADVAVLVVVGAVLGRAVIGVQPTLAAGLVAIGTLVILRLATGLLERSALRALVTVRPLLLIGGGEPVQHHLRRARVDDEDLRVALRLAGIATIGEVAAAVLEPNGAISVARRDPQRPLDRRLFAEVRGVERIPPDWFGAPAEG